MNSNTDIDSEIRSIEAQFGSLAIRDLGNKIVSPMMGNHPEYRWISLVSITGVGGIVVSANRNPQQAYIHFNNNGNKHTMTFQSKNGPTNNPDKGSATFVNSVRNGFNQAQAEYKKSREILGEAKGIYSPIGNYQQIIFITNQATWSAEGFSFFRRVYRFLLRRIDLP